MTPSLNAITLQVSDIHASQIFYQALGIEFDDDMHGYLGNTILGLHAAHPASRVHLSLTVPDLDAVARNLTKLQAPVTRDPNLPIIVTLDPDGNRLMLVRGEP